MLTNFAEKMLNIGKGAVHEAVVDGKPWMVEGGKFKFPPVETARSLNVHTLGAVMDYLRSGVDPAHPSRNNPGSLFVHVENLNTVRVLTPVLNTPTRDREQLLVARALEGNGFPFGDILDQETAMIELQRAFEKTSELLNLLQFVGGLKSIAEAEEIDDGVVQHTTIKTGVFAVESVEVPNPVRLVTRCTFPEIDQPTREYVFRLGKNNTIALHPTGDLLWHVQTIERIAEFLSPIDGDNWVVLS